MTSLTGSFGEITAPPEAQVDAAHHGHALVQSLHQTFGTEQSCVWQGRHADDVAPAGSTIIGCKAKNVVLSDQKSYRLLTGSLTPPDKQVASV